MLAQSRPSSAARAPLSADVRLRALAEYDILDTPPEEAFDRLVALTSAALKMPVVTINFLDDRRHYVKAISVGVAGMSLPLSESLCAHTLWHSHLVVVPDARLDARFTGLPMVQDDTIVFYAAAPLITADGHRLGTLCVTDTRPHQWSDEERGLLHGFAQLVVDQLELRRARTRERRTRLRLEGQARVLDDLSEAVISTDLQFRATTWNPAATRMYGWTSEEIQGLNLSQLIQTEFLDTTAEEMLASLTARGSWAGEVMQRHKDGHRLRVRARTSLLRDEAGQAVGVITVNEDVSEHHAMVKRLEHLAYHDPLTGLPNRSSLRKHLTNLSDETHGTPAPYGLLFIDLDDFKRINDTSGHRAGDAALLEVAQRLRRVVALGGSLSRISGDEFVVVVRDVADPTHLEALAEQLMSALAKPLPLGGQVVSITTSVGIALSENGVPPDDVLRRADTAMYHAKSLGKHRAAVYQPELDECRQRRAALAHDLAAGLERGEVYVQWQPRVELTTGRTVGVEALARWNHPERGSISPAEFIPVAEESGLIHELGRVVLREACLQGVRWAQSGTPVRVAVNVSTVELVRETFIGDVEAALRESGLPARLLELEVTEGTAMSDVLSNAARLRMLADLGVTIAIDDFGTGYSSLSYLRQLPAQVIKIDRSFVRGLASHGVTSCDEAIVRAIVTLAHSVGKRVVAEGIETGEQRAVLLALGCEEGQGYLFSRPVDASSVSAQLREPAVDVGVIPGMIQEPPPGHAGAGRPSGAAEQTLQPSAP